jgi:hypothetical protein
MKKWLVILLAACALPLAAHPPRSIELGYDGESATLTVKVLHRVSDPARHFVSRIEVRSGKELLAERTYDRQETASGREEAFSLAERPPAQGDTLVVTVFCSLSGEKSAELKL